MSDNFVHLHVHTEYSLLDGACRIREIAKKAKSMGQTALAITDHGVMYGCVEFFKACRAEGIKAIIGCEVYVSPTSRHDKDVSNSRYNHLVLLCKNEIGYRNLIKMVSLGFTEGFYAKPRIDMELLSLYHEGLVALSGCISGYVPRKILDANTDEARAHALKMKSLFGDDYYFELQRHGLSEQELVNSELIKLSRELDIPLVATNDAHYIEKGDAETQRVLMCIQTGTTLSDGKGMGFDKEEFYLKSTQQMKDLFYDVPESISNTCEIADKCNFEFCFDRIFLPAFYPPNNLASKDYLRELCQAGLQKRIEGSQAESMQVYKDRLDYELSVVNKMGYDEYYLIVNDFISYAKNKGIPVGPGRGSGAGSLAAYCLGITDVDPIKHELLFERFLNPERVSMPDFDVDFCYYRRQEVIDYVAEKYGKDHVAQIVTFGTLAAKAAIRDVGRVLGMSYGEVDRVAKLIPARAMGVTIERALEESAELRELARDDFKVGSLIKIAKKIEGMPRNTSTHAAGVVITNEPVMSYVPLSKNGDVVVTQYTMNDVADLGLLKIDFLGLRYLTVIYDAAREAGINVFDIPLDDEKTFRTLSMGDTSGVFQLESGGMRSLLVKMEPRSIEDITIAISLYRPGPMDSIPKFLANRKNQGNVTYLHPSLEQILSVTNGCIVYQEQVMQIFRLLAGYSYGRADIVRRAMSKKKQSVMDEERQYFIYGKRDEHGNVEVPGAIANGVSQEAAKAIYDDMATFAQYAFNKSHAACYAYLAYYTAYLKCHYKREYMASLISSVMGYTEKVMEYIAECKKMGIEVKRPDVNTSTLSFSADNDGIVFGLMAIKNVGEGFCKNIIAKRSKGKYLSLEDFLSRLCDSEINKRMVESLIKAGALDCFGKKRSALMAVYSDAVDALQRRNHKNVEGQFDMFSSVQADDDMTGALSVNYPDIPEFSSYEKLVMEKEMTGLYLSGHPLEKYASTAAHLKCDKAANINKAACDGDKSKYFDGKTVTLLGIASRKTEKLTKSDARMAFVDLEDETGTLELIVFPKVYEASIQKIYEGAVLGVVGEISLKEAKDTDDEQKQEPKILVRSIFDVKAGREPPVRESADKGDGKRVKVNLSSLMQSSVGNIDEVPKNDRQTVRQDLYLKVSSEKWGGFEGVKSILEIYSYGDTEIYVYFEDTSKLVRMTGAKCHVTETMLKALCRILGNENVKLKDKKD